MQRPSKGFEQPGERLQELGGRGAVDDAVVRRECEPHPVMHAHLVTDNYGLASRQAPVRVR